MHVISVKTLKHFKKLKRTRNVADDNLFGGLRVKLSLVFRAHMTSKNDWPLKAELTVHVGFQAVCTCICEGCVLAECIWVNNNIPFFVKCYWSKV